MWKIRTKQEIWNSVCLINVWMCVSCMCVCVLELWIKYAHTIVKFICVNYYRNIYVFLCECFVFHFGCTYCERSNEKMKTKILLQKWKKRRNFVCLFLCENFFLVNLCQSFCVSVFLCIYCICIEIWESWSK